MSISTHTPRREPTRFQTIQCPEGAVLMDRAAAGFILSRDAIRKWASNIDKKYYDPQTDWDGGRAYCKILRQLETQRVYREAVIHWTQIEPGEYMLVMQIKEIEGVQGWEGMPKELLPMFEE
ncbi:hypothetical protein CC2G_002684 [Coprinopsis cinerea AmutBmut pab1-1]|nr:hypothetical protein CC2G_002684 [Coprinopsis cinerea AmutBmut pab1-1]